MHQEKLLLHTSHTRQIPTIKGCSNPIGETCPSQSTHSLLKTYVSLLRRMPSIPLFRFVLLRTSRDNQRVSLLVTVYDLCGLLKSG